MVFYPPFLKENSLVGITCPSGYVAEDRVAYAVTTLEKWGFAVRKGKTIGSEHGYFSGTDEQRLQDLQNMMDDPAIDAILMGRGGYGMSRIIDEIDFTAFVEKPKWICGFSDITVLHSHIQANYNIATLHSPMCGTFKPETWQEEYLTTLCKALKGEPLSYKAAPSPYNRYGKATGTLTGGNLAILAHLTGSASEAGTAGKLLFIEDIAEYLYNVDRLLINLKRAGKLEEITGLIVGCLTDLQDTERPFGQPVEEIILDKVKEYTYPVCFNFPSGHQEVNYTLTLGAAHTLIVDEQGGFLTL